MLTMSEVKRRTQAPRSTVKIQVCRSSRHYATVSIYLISLASRLLLPPMSILHTRFPIHEKCKTSLSILGRLCLNRVHSLAPNLVTRIRILTGEAHSRSGQNVAPSRLGEIRGGRAIRNQAALAVGRSTGQGRAARLGGDTGRGGLGRGDSVALRLGDRCSGACSGHGLGHLIRLCLDHCDRGRLGRAIAESLVNQTSKFWRKVKTGLRDCCNGSHSFRDIRAG